MKQFLSLALVCVLFIASTVSIHAYYSSCPLIYEDSCSSSLSPQEKKAKKQQSLQDQMDALRTKYEKAQESYNKSYEQTRTYTVNPNMNYQSFLNSTERTQKKQQKLFELEDKMNKVQDKMYKLW